MQPLGNEIVLFFNTVNDPISLRMLTMTRKKQSFDESSRKVWIDQTRSPAPSLLLGPAMQMYPVATCVNE